MAIKQSLVWVALFAVQSVFGAGLSVTAEKVFGKQRFVDRTESSGFHRQGAVTPHLNSALFLPLGISISNLNTTFRGITSELLRVDFSGNVSSLGRMGDIDRVIAVDANTLLVQTRLSLSLFDILSGEQVWKLPLRKSNGALAGTIYKNGSAVYLQESSAAFLLKIDPISGETLARIIPDPKVGKHWGASSLIGKDQLVVFGDNRFSLINEKGQVQWQVGKVYPERSYGAGFEIGNGKILLQEYISAANPNENLKRRTAITVASPDGKEIWSRIDKLRFLVEGETALYFEEQGVNGDTNVLAVNKVSGQNLWRSVIEKGKYVYLNAKENQGILVVGSGKSVSVLATTSGGIQAQRGWEDRAQVQIHAIKDSVIIVSSRLNTEPHQDFLTHLSLK